MFPQKFIKAAREELFPESYTCLLCGIEIFEGRFCRECHKQIVYNSGATCPVCGRKTAENEICIECKAYLPAYKKAVSPLVYKDGSVALIALLKNGRPYISGWLAERMAEKSSLLPTVDGMVFVPATSDSVRRRGYNQSELLARELSRLTDIAIFFGAVKKIAGTKTQKALSRAERITNLLKCFKAEKGIVGGKKILVVDDVTTTGATLNSVAVCLKKAGASEVYCVTAASVEYQFSAKPNETGKL